MDDARRRRLTMVLAAVAVACLALIPAVARAKPGHGKGGHAPGKPVVGADSLGDPLFPQIGNGGYDVRHYEIELDYDPAANAFESARTTITARAKRTLRRFTLDFQDLDVTRVTMNGKRAEYRQREATPDLSPNPDVTQPMKLEIDPHPSARPKRGRSFEVVVSYRGEPGHVTDPDTSIEGWIRACFPLQPPQTCDGAFVVNEPIGAQSWFPSNNYPTDKARFDTKITVPAQKTALGVGELVRRRDNGDGTATWHWREDDPTATYLSTATVGDFLYEVGSMTETTTGRELPVYTAIDSSSNSDQVAAIEESLARAPGMLSFLSGIYGPYPFDSTGAVVDRAAGVGYALEVQTKPHFAGGFTTGNPSVGVSTLLHELAHQWLGNSITLADWTTIWFNEGWATWSELYWAFETGESSQSPAQFLDDLYANASDEDWATAPAVLDGDPANLFHTFPVYERSAAMLQGYREIVGDERFFELATELTRDRAYGNISTVGFVRLAKRVSGFTGERLARLDEYFRQWLFGTVKPTLLPEDF